MTLRAFNLLVIVLAALFFGAVYLLTLPKKAPEAAVKPAGVVTPQAPTPKPPAEPSEKEIREQEDTKRIKAAVQRCKSEKRVAVIGYGWEVVCLKPETIAWHEGPQQ